MGVDNIERTLDVPWWAKALAFIVKFLPLPPWIKLLIPLIIQIIEAIPSREERKAAKREITEAVELAKDGYTKPLEDVVSKHWKRHCDGVACPADLKG